MSKNKTLRYVAKVRIFSNLYNRTFEAGEMIEYPADQAKELKPLIVQGILERTIDTENENATQG